MITASASTSVGTSAQKVLEFILDLDRYRQIDTKIVRVMSVVGPNEAGAGSVSLLGKLKGLPPAPDRQNFQLVRWKSLTFVGAPRQPGRLVFNFTGTFECAETHDGQTLVTHTYEFAFKGPFRFIERRLQPWLQREIEIEVANLNAVLAT